YVWVWIPNTSINAKYNITPATAAAAPAQCTKSTPGGKTLFTISFTPANFFTSDISAQTQMGILLKGVDWPNGQTTDYVVNFLIGSNFQTTLISPVTNPLFVTNGSTVSVQASASASAQFNLYINNKLFNSTPSVTNYQLNLTASDTLNYYLCNLVITSGTNIDTLSFSYLFSQASPSAPRPAGIIDGINYHASDQTKVTLCFWAPNKTSVYAFGDFTSWNVDPKYLMNRDGEHFWVEIDGLTAGTEYAFQYLVNDTLRIADPYTDKILEQGDNVIPATTYPNLKTVPASAMSSQWYFNHFSVLQTGQTPYAWQTTNYVKPAKEKLVIYELLIRDFFDSNNRNFQNLIDTISYFKRLGINAVELMPVAEFNGAIGWGYNPTSMFAVQKYYGTKNKLKEFVDKCHANGIAVIMDLVMNHQDIPNSYAMLDYDFVNGKPKSSNKWFNVVAPHPYSVFNDLNHDSPYTRKYLDTINYYWMHEFKVDGYRYDLSKGFTQFNSGSNVGLWGQYDQSRVNNLQRMAQVLWSKYPDAYIILEHFAANSEETVLANYQVNQNQGMMLWENFNYAYNQNTMGFASGSDISGMYYGNKGWTAPRAVGYMESHDEERLMYNNEQFANAYGNYSAKTLDTALVRMKAASLVFYTIPGPKMLWEFGEMGYDQSINECVNGTVDNSGNCRLDPKPVLWSYLQNPNRLSLWRHTQDLLRLRKNYNLFTTTGAAQFNTSGLVQQIVIKNSPYTSAPVDSSQMNAVVVANMDVSYQNAAVNFPHTGTWYDYYNGGKPVSVTASPVTVQMRPGSYKLYTDIKIKSIAVVTAVENKADVELTLFPNPTHDRIHISTAGSVLSLQVRTLTGQALNLHQIDETSWDVSTLTSGLYLVEIKTDAGMVRKKMIKY
ncbi:MAG: T9SS type A sorting domain-containing protein, partial [Bacteroidetes bacterium]|nr:T9SS type A sorting domain-containing protein [Bacteroidota bacterium]